MLFSTVTLSALVLAASAKIHDITVGGAGKLTFDPEAIFADPGDQVVFHFVSKNHTVTQSTLAEPCSKNTDDGAFDSGFMPVPANQTDNFPSYTIDVKDTKPIWAYCKQGKDTPQFHCGKGMIFSVNCGPEGAANSFTNFKKEALAIGSSLAAAAPSSTDGGASATGAPSGGDSASGALTAPYGSATLPPPDKVETVTQTVTWQSSTWTTAYPSASGASVNPTPNPSPSVIKVQVGADAQLMFNPSSVQARPMDIIQFEFVSKNHSVVQSAFADPCRPLADGFKSGFMPVANSTTDFPTFNYTVTGVDPVWAYCSQKAPKSHCGAGMVFAINANEAGARNFGAFQTLAEQLNATAAQDNAPSATGSDSASPSASGKNGASAVGMSAAALLGAVVLGFATLL